MEMLNQIRDNKSQVKTETTDAGNKTK
jgi:hypothetical protein